MLSSGSNETSDRRGTLRPWRDGPGGGAASETGPGPAVRVAEDVPAAVQACSDFPASPDDGGDFLERRRH